MGIREAVKDVFQYKHSGVHHRLGAKEIVGYSMMTVSEYTTISGSGVAHLEILHE